MVNVRSTAEFVLMSLRRQRLVDLCEFETSLSYIVRPSINLLLSQEIVKLDRP